MQQLGHTQKRLPAQMLTCRQNAADFEWHLKQQTLETASVEQVNRLLLQQRADAGTDSLNHNSMGLHHP
jgi:hypothetical protein